MSEMLLTSCLLPFTFQSLTVFLSYSSLPNLNVTAATVDPAQACVTIWLTLAGLLLTCGPEPLEKPLNRRYRSRNLTHLAM